ncbi:MAG: hypothetical protein LBD51_00905, partial [Bifidobacteriaceae bacterium]|jgi:hypothetical protein|nr:hypothetical protein [Bifidobacteriaceae bacterium]
LIDLAGVADAIGRGKALAQIHERNHVERLRRNPSTEVGRLAEQVWAACDAQRSTRQRAG